MGSLLARSSMVIMSLGVTSAAEVIEQALTKVALFVEVALAIFSWLLRRQHSVMEIVEVIMLRCSTPQTQ